jgi:hypothetical protein
MDTNVLDFRAATLTGAFKIKGETFTINFGIFKIYLHIAFIFEVKEIKESVRVVIGIIHSDIPERIYVLQIPRFGTREVALILRMR